MNKVFLIGNFTRDPELTETNSGVSVCRFSIAVNRSYTTEGERQTDFFNCTAWRGVAENVARFCKKGNKAAITGSLQIRNWEDNDGNKHQGVDVIVQEVEFLTPKREEDEGRSRRDESFGKRHGRKPALESYDDDGDIPF